VECLEFLDRLEGEFIIVEVGENEKESMDMDGQSSE